MKNMAILLFSIVLILGIKLAPRAPIDQCVRLHQDLHYVHQTMQDNLGVYQVDAELRARADQAYAQQMQARCVSELDYVRGLRAYFASFHDPHVMISWHVRPGMVDVVNESLGHPMHLPELKLHFTATGLLLKKIGDGYFIRAYDSPSDSTHKIALGDELLRCDGRSPEQILDQDVLPFEQVSVRAAGLYRHADKIFFRWDQEPGVVSHCRFRHGTEEYDTKLKWSEVYDNYLVNHSEPAGETYSIEATPYGHWVKLRSLASYDAQEVTKLQKFVADADQLAQDAVIVLDLRGNSGGDSSWGDQWIEKLFGYLPYEAGQSDLVFGSAGNRAHFERMYTRFEQTGALKNPGLKSYLQGMIAFMKAHPCEMMNGDSDPHPIAAPKPPPSKFHGRVVVVTDARVFSSGELFLQKLKQMPNVTQVGLATDASTQAGDLRFAEAPSGAVFSVPTKVFRSIFVGRKPGQAIEPEIVIQPIAEREFAKHDSVREQVEALPIVQSRKTARN